MTAVEMPKYKCHKVVHALKIKEVFLENPVRLSFEDKRYAPITLWDDDFNKHQPKPGGYYVVYEDGYKSFSPAKAFEEGYTLID